MDENESNRQIGLQQLRDKRDAYLAVFGIPGQRTIHQERVLRDIDSYCKRGQETLHITSTGAADPFVTFYRDGKKNVADRIHLMMEWKEHGDSNRNPDGPGE